MDPGFLIYSTLDHGCTVDYGRASDSIVNHYHLHIILALTDFDKGVGAIEIAYYGFITVRLLSSSTP